MAAYGIIGYPLTHSFSPAYFATKFASGHIDASYTAFPLSSINDLPALLHDNPKLRGLNVTIPYKESVIAFLDETDEEAKKVGAVNCISITQGKTKGYNTDMIGFRQSLLPLLQPHHGQALILGTGGASRAVAHVLDTLGIVYKKVSRTPAAGILSYNAVSPEMIATNTLIINTTPMGMAPNKDAYPPIDYAATSDKHLLYDLIYNPAETKFLSLGRQHGAQIKNGLEMLHIQAEASWDIWNS